MAAGRPDPTAKQDLDTLLSTLSGGSSEPVAKPVVAEVDGPKYLAWKSFGPGAKATYVYRGLGPRQPGDSQLVVPGAPSVRFTYTLQSITGDAAKLWLTEITYDYPSRQAHPARDTEVYYPAKMPSRQQPADSPTAAGEEVLNIAGRTIATHWQSVPKPARACIVVTTWTSDQVPGALVRETEDSNCQGTRIIRETILESFTAPPTGTRK
jgi:hypothetical protein